MRLVSLWLSDAAPHLLGEATSRASYAPTMKRATAGAGYSCSPSFRCPRWCLWRRRRIGLSLAIVLAVFAPPAGADTKSAYKVHPGGVELILPVERKGGYVISVSANGRQRIRFTVEGPSSAVEYLTKGRVSDRHIEADFGDLGRISVRLNLVRQPSDPPRDGRCKGRAPLYKNGVYQGIIELSGKPGVPKIAVRRGQAYFGHRFRQVCKRRRSQPKPDLYPKLTRKEEEGVLIVDGKGEGRAVRLWATIFALKRSPAYSGGTSGAAVYERSEGVRITRRTGGFFFHNSFVMSRRGTMPETIDVKPPKPFAGRARYSRSPGLPPSWTGDLKVDLPGAVGIPLTGPGFSATLCRGKVDSCLWKRRGSGSRML